MWPSLGSSQADHSLSSRITLPTSRPRVPTTCYVGLCISYVTNSQHTLVLSLRTRGGGSVLDMAVLPLWPLASLPVPQPAPIHRLNDRNIQHGARLWGDTALKQSAGREQRKGSDAGGGAIPAHEPPYRKASSPPREKHHEQQSSPSVPFHMPQITSQ